MEALKYIASAWSWAFIIMFVILAVYSDSFHEPPITLFFVLLIGAVTGIGWLVYRSVHRMKGT